LNFYSPPSFSGGSLRHVATFLRCCLLSLIVQVPPPLPTGPWSAPLSLICTEAFLPTLCLSSFIFSSVFFLGIICLSVSVPPGDFPPGLGRCESVIFSGLFFQRFGVIIGIPCFHVSPLVLGLTIPSPSRLGARPYIFVRKWGELGFLFISAPVVCFSSFLPPCKFPVRLSGSREFRFPLVSSRNIRVLPSALLGDRSRGSASYWGAVEY